MTLKFPNDDKNEWVWTVVFCIITTAYVTFLVGSIAVVFRYLK